MILFLEIFFGMCYVLTAAFLLVLSGESGVEFWPKHVGKKWAPVAMVLQGLAGVAMFAAGIVFVSGL